MPARRVLARGRLPRTPGRRSCTQAATGAADRPRPRSARLQADRGEPRRRHRRAGAARRRPPAPRPRAPRGRAGPARGRATSRATRAWAITRCSRRALAHDRLGAFAAAADAYRDGAASAPRRAPPLRGAPARRGDEHAPRAPGRSGRGAERGRSRPARDRSPRRCCSSSTVHEKKGDRRAAASPRTGSTATSRPRRRRRRPRRG